MKITTFDTIQCTEYPNVTWVQVHTDAGLIGLGETYFGPEAVSGYIHETVAPKLLGQDPLRIDQHSKTLLNYYVGFSSSGAELRGASAVDIALWDLFGQSTNLPIHQLLGGLSRDRVRTYNTCGGYTYGRKGVGTNNFGMGKASKDRPYEDLEAFLHRADELAISLLEQGITGMKIWPFDYAAEATGGNYISMEDLKKGCEPFAKIRKAVGDKMDIHVEFHLLWNLPTVKTICAALEEYKPFWYEDPIKMNNFDALAELARSTRVPITASETLATRFAYRELMSKNAASIIMPDLSWIGGISEAKKVATMAEAHHLPIAPHDCTGPIVFIASIHLSLNAPNTLVQESVRAYYTDWYRDIVTEMPRIEKGYIYPMQGAGLGTKLQPSFLKRPDVKLRQSKL
jgi:galactonate dehydratase